MKYTYILSLLAVMFLASCGDVEDTYDEYAGDGPIRYLAKCNDVKVVSGWEKLVVSWKNNLDPNRDSILIKCEAERYSFDTLVGAKETSCTIRGLKDATYSVTVVGRDRAGNMSLANEAVATGRPYTLHHEAVQGFTRGILKHVFLKNNLVVFTTNYSENVVDFKLHYEKMNAEKDSCDLFEEGGNEILFLENVDVEKPIVLKRKGRLEGCDDLITFPDEKLERNVNMGSDFKAYLTERYGEEEFKSEEFMNRGELELDYDLMSLEDILYFPNLTKLEFGKNRYYANDVNWSKILDENRERSEKCIQILKEVNPDLVVKNYGEHYSMVNSDVEELKERRVEDLDELELLDGTKFEISDSEETKSVGRLLDNDPKTYWEPKLGTKVRTYEVTIDMKEVKEVKGLKIVQAQAVGNAENFLPNSIVVQVAKTGKGDWIDLGKFILGVSLGEAKVLKFAKPEDIQYIRLTLKDVYFERNTGCVLGDVLPF